MSKLSLVTASFSVFAATALVGDAMAAQSGPNFAGTYRCQPGPESCQNSGNTFTVTQMGNTLEVKNDKGSVGQGTVTSNISISMGPILDRTREHMVAADRAVIHLRLRLLESVRRHEDGEQPIGLGVDVSDVRSLPDTVILPDHPWQALVPGNVGASRAGTSDAAS